MEVAGPMVGPTVNVLGLDQDRKLKGQSSMEELKGQSITTHQHIHLQVRTQMGVTRLQATEVMGLEAVTAVKRDQAMVQEALHPPPRPLTSEIRWSPSCARAKRK